MFAVKHSTDATHLHKQGKGSCGKFLVPLLIRPLDSFLTVPVSQQHSMSMPSWPQGIRGRDNTWGRIRKPCAATQTNCKSIIRLVHKTMRENGKCCYKLLSVVEDTKKLQVKCFRKEGTPMKINRQYSWKRQGRAHVNRHSTGKSWGLHESKISKT